MYATFNTEILRDEIARNYRTIDRLTAKLDAGQKLSMAERDALQAAHAANNAQTSVLLDQLAAKGQDFVSIDCGTYSLCYSLEESRWEGFVSTAA